MIVCITHDKMLPLIPEPEVVVPEKLLVELVGLRVAYAQLLYKYVRELRNSPESQEVFVETLPRLLHKEVNKDCNFQTYFDTLIEREVSLFNITYLKKICDIFPKDVW